MTRWTPKDLKYLASLKGVPPWLTALTFVLWSALDEANHCRVTCWARDYLRKKGIDVRFSPDPDGVPRWWWYCWVNHDSRHSLKTEKAAILAGLKSVEKGTDHA